MRAVDIDLRPTRVAEPVRGALLLLHGGQETSTERVTGSSAAWLRMAVLHRDLGRRLGPRGVAVWLLRYGVRGWNERRGAEPDPVRDARKALALLSAAAPVPLVVVGHSMGGRVACAVADDGSVSGVIALAPWLPPGTPVESLRGKTLVVAHGDHDVRTSASASRSYVEMARKSGVDASYVEMTGSGHAMLRRAGHWHRLTREVSVRILALDRVSS